MDAHPDDVAYRRAALDLIDRLAAGHDPDEALAAVIFPLDDEYHDPR